MRLSWPWLISGASTAVAAYALIELRRLQRDCVALNAQTIDTSFGICKHSESSTSIPEQIETRLLLAGVELGGTTCVAALAYADDPTNIIEKFVVETGHPRDTLAKICKWLDNHSPFVSLGIAAFGPVDLNPSSDTYGHLTTTPKMHWAHYNILQHFVHYRVPIGLDTDVNAPALAEFAHGNYSHGANSCAYITVGTGVGVGVVVDGKPVHGLMHPEGGHIMAERHPHDTYTGWSMIHRSSVESMAAAQACSDRCGVPMDKLAEVRDDDPTWDFVAYYIAQLCFTVTLILSPHYIVLSGGVMQRSSLFPKIRKHFARLNSGYINVKKIRDELDTYLVPSSFARNSGIVGAIELSRRVTLLGTPKQ